MTSTPSTVARWAGSRGRIRGRPDILLVALAALLPLLPTLRVRIEGPDEGMLLLDPDLMRSGLTPNADFFTVYGPVGYRLLQGAYSVFGLSMLTERGVAIGYHVAIAVAVTLLVRRYSTGAGLVAGLLSAAVGSGATPVAFAWLGAMAALTWAQVALDRGTTRGALLGGVLAGLAVGFRYEFVVFLPVALFMARRPQRGAAALGLGAGLAPTAWHVLTHYDAVWRDVGGRLGINGRQEADWLDWFAGGTVLVPSAAFALIVSAVLLRRQGRPARMVATSAALAVLGLPEAIQRIDYYHSMFIGIVTVPLAVAAVLLSRPAGPPLAPGSAGARRLRLIVGALVVGLAVSCTFLAVSAPAYTVERAGRSLYVTEVQQAEMRSVLRAVEGAAPAGSRLFVGADDMTLPTANENYYHLLLPDYPPAGRFTELAPGLSEKRGSGLEDDVRNAHVVILTRMDAAAVARNLPHLPRGDNPANEIIRREFTRVASFSYTEVWRRR